MDEYSRLKLGIFQSIIWGESVCSVSSMGVFASAVPAVAQPQCLAQSYNLSIHKQQGQTATGRLKMAPTNHPPHINSISLF